MKLFYFFIIILFISCKQISSYNISDFEKHPEINVFLFDTINLEAKHYYDRAWLHFSFQTNSVNEHSIMELVDSIAISNDWEKIESTENSGNYIKSIKSYPADSEMDTLYFNYNSIDKRLNFKWH